MQEKWDYSRMRNLYEIGTKVNFIYFRLGYGVTSKPP